ncbi:hypothetical protein [Salinicola peritrichatus]|uniref:hypothetical protein n=1 Tax=Salinicola peritrichatus TaxID=1267424 RepID=UPI0013A60295|nr:hypothetical protein [Salinicola peritrichatus]
MTLADRQDYAGVNLVYDCQDVLDHCYEHPAYAEMMSRWLSGERSDSLDNVLREIWNWAAAWIACLALGCEPEDDRLVREHTEAVDSALAAIGWEVKDGKLESLLKSAA